MPILPFAGLLDHRRAVLSQRCVPGRVHTERERDRCMYSVDEHHHHHLELSRYSLGWEIVAREQALILGSGGPRVETRGRLCWRQPTSLSLVSGSAISRAVAVAVTYLSSSFAARAVSNATVVVVSCYQILLYAYSVLRIW